MKKIDTKKIGTGNRIAFPNILLDVNDYEDHVYFGTMNGVLFMSEEPFNDCTMRKIDRASSAIIWIPSKLAKECDIYPGLDCSIYLDNRDILIIPTEKETELIAQLTN